jgi:hypothetical protein
VARRLWGDLVCLCGRCQRLTLAACHCPDAAAERLKVVELLHGRDLAAPAQAEVAYQAVVQDYVTRFGRKVLTSEGTGPSTTGDWPALAVSIGVIAVACASVILFEAGAGAARDHVRDRGDDSAGKSCPPGRLRVSARSAARAPNPSTATITNV